MKTVRAALVLVATIGCGARAAEPRSAPLPPLGPAARGGVVAPGARYALPSCPLAYETMTLETQTTESAPPENLSVGLQTMMKIDATTEGERMALGLTVVAHPFRGRHRPFLFPDDKYAKPLLATDGHALREVDGPTQAWSAMGTQGGLVWFFPALPRSGEPGATTEWEIARPDPSDVVATEARRGTRGQYPEPRPERAAEPTREREPLRATVRLERWSEEGGVRVAHLAARAESTFEEQPLADIRTSGVGRWRGTYAVLASGRLLSAEVEKDLDVTMVTTIDAKPLTQRHAMHATMKMHLVGACNGPTATHLLPAPSREERAIVAYADTWTAVSKGERAAALAGFDAALRKKHGDAAIWAALGAYRSERGDHALSPPLLLGDEDVEADPSGKSVRVKTHGTTPDRSTTNTLTPLVVAVELREDGGRFVVTSLRSDLVVANGNLLEISPAALVVRRGWPPK